MILHRYHFVEHIVKEYGASSSGSPTPSGQQGMGSFVAKQMKTAAGTKAKQIGGMAKSMAKNMVKGQDSQTTQRIRRSITKLGTPSQTIMGKSKPTGMDSKQMMKRSKKKGGKVENKAKRLEMASLMAI